MESYRAAAEQVIWFRLYGLDTLLQVLDIWC
jgi:hypothetical protein